MNNYNIKLAYHEGINRNGYMIEKGHLIEALKKSKELYDIPVFIHRGVLQYCEPISELIPNIRIGDVGEHESILIGRIKEFNFDNMTATIESRCFIKNVDLLVLGFTYRSAIDDNDTNVIQIIDVTDALIMEKELSAYYKEGDE